MDFSNVKQLIIPEGEVKQIAIGGAIVWKKPLYDAQVEYLESDGAQWIDTGLGYFADFEIDIMLRSSVSNKAIGTSNSNCMQRVSAANPVWRFSYGGSSYDSSVSIVERHNVAWINGNIICDGTVVGNMSKSFASGTMSLFGAGGQAFPNVIYSCKLYNSSNELVRDYVPVRKNGVGYLFDKVSETLFGKSSTL